MTWPIQSLSAALSTADVFVDGDWVESKDQDPDGDVRLIQLADVGDGAYLDKSSRFLTSSKASALRCTLLRPGDVLVARMPDPLGRACIFPGDAKTCVTVVDVCVIRPGPSGPDPRYLMHCINSPACRSQILSFATGTTRSRISRSNLSKIRIPVPVLADQCRIADILDKADAVRAKRRAALARMDALTQSIFRDVSRSSHESERSLALGEVAEPSRGSFVNGPFGSDLLTSELQSTGVPVIYIRDIVNREYRRISTSCVSEIKARELAVCGVRGGDVLITKVGDPPGVAAVYPKDAPEAVVTQDVIRLRVSRDVATPEYVAAYLNSSEGRRKIREITVQATRARFSLGRLKGVQIELPPLHVQTGYLERLRVAEALREVGRRQLEHLDALFASLQHRAFRGEL